MSETPNSSEGQPNDRRISRMDSKTAKSLSSGQVITNLTNVVKELLENAIDAKSTVITIRFKEMGKELIEVADNGFGISKHDFICLAKRNCTSKLDDFEGLSSIVSFGFRGEALNSLCTLSEVSIQTRHLNDAIGSHLKFDSDANIVSEQLIARNVGTTVSVQNLFYSIPVRKKEFFTNIKREFDKMLRLVYSYCVGSVGLRITLTNQMANKSKQTVVSSPGLSIRNNIIEVFDVKQSNLLIEFKQSTQSFEELNSDPIIEISGFISKCDSGCGRSATDRQFLYVNRRPCDMKNISKFINDIYRTFNRNQYPFVLINVSIDTNCVDFNLTPDKRQLLIQYEDKIFVLIKESLIKIFNKENACPLNSMASYLIKDTQSSRNSESNPYSKFLSQMKRKEAEDQEVAAVMSSPPFKIVRSRSPCDSHFQESTSCDSAVITPPILEERDFEPPVQQNSKPKSFISAMNAMNDKTIQKPQIECRITSERNQNNINSVPQTGFKPINEDIHFCVRDVPFDSSEKRMFRVSEMEDKAELKTAAEPKVNTSKCLTECTIVYDSDEENETNNEWNKETALITKILSQSQSQSESRSEGQNESQANTETNDPKTSETDDIVIDFNSQQIKRLNLKSKERKESTNGHKFSAKINASQNDRAEQELIHELNKNSFEEMKVIGQFNKGFIIAKLESDLFIVDQHASDERYNFETLMTNTPIETQNLVRPMPLELSAANEMVVVDHLNVFKKLGFGIVINESAAPGHRIRMSSIPISKEWTAGKEDIDEIVGKIIETPIELMKGYKLDSFKKVIASRACRYSVMIGTSQTNSQMKAIVSKMSELKNPWHCAHNRPTIRHLANLSDISSLSPFE